jgi:hypothetical protein
MGALWSVMGSMGACHVQKRRLYIKSQPDRQGRGRCSYGSSLGFCKAPRWMAASGRRKGGTIDRRTGWSGWCIYKKNDPRSKGVKAQMHLVVVGAMPGRMGAGRACICPPRRLVFWEDRADENVGPPPNLPEGEMISYPTKQERKAKSARGCPVRKISNTE